MNSGSLNTIQSMYMNTGGGPQKVWENEKFLDLSRLQGTSGGKSNCYYDNKGSVYFKITDDGSDSAVNKYVELTSMINYSAQFDFTVSTSGMLRGFGNAASFGFSTDLNADINSCPMYGIHFYNVWTNSYDSYHVRLKGANDGSADTWVRLVNNTAYRIFYYADRMELYSLNNGSIVGHVATHIFPIPLNLLKYLRITDVAWDNGGNTKEGIINTVIYK